MFKAATLIPFILSIGYADSFQPAKINRYTGDITIDGRNGKTTGNTSQTQCASASVVIKNKQPFLYQYSFENKITLIDEPGLAGLNAIFGSTLALLEKAKEVPGDGGAPNAKTACPNAETITKLSQEMSIDFRKYSDSFEKLVKAHKASSKAIDKEWTILQDFSSAEKALDASATNLVEESKKISAEAKELKNLAGSLEQLIALANTLLQFSEGEGCKTAFATARMAAQTLIDASDKYKETSDDIAKEIKKFTDLSEFVSKIAIDGDRYEEAAGNFGPFSNPSKVNWTLKLSEWKGKNTKEFKGEFAFGTPRFHIAAGLAFSPLNSLEYARVDSIAADGTKQIRVGRSSSSNFRVQPMAMVHGRINSCAVSRIPLYVSAGITAKADNKGTVPEYLIGLSTSFVDERIFLTGGLYVGKSQILQGGIQEGSIIPSSLAELPIAKGYRSAIGFALTYRFK